MTHPHFTHAAFTQAQADHLTSMHVINRIDDHLKLVSSIELIGGTAHSSPRVMLLLEIYYNNDKFDTLSFDLENYSYKDIIHLVKNIRENEFILREVDNFLGGDGIE